MINFYNLDVIGEGGEGTVFNYNGKALKVFNNNQSEKISNILEEINLDYIVTPDKVIYEENKYLGYTMKLLDNIRPLKELKKDELLSSLYLLKKDLIKLSEYNIIAQDLIPRNSLNSNHQIYFIDTSLYITSDREVDFIRNTNLKGLDKYEKCLLGYSAGSLDARKKYLSIKDNIEELIDSKMYSSETVEQFAKRII